MGCFDQTDVARISKRSKVRDVKARRRNTRTERKERRFRQYILFYRIRNARSHVYFLITNNNFTNFLSLPFQANQ